MAPRETVSPETPTPQSALKTILYRKEGVGGSSGRVSIRTLKEMISHWEIGPDDWIRLDGDPVERKVREYPALSPLDEMLNDVLKKVQEVRRGQGSRSTVVRELEMLLDYAEHNDRVYSVASLVLGYLRYSENPALARGLFLKALERGYPVPAVARNNLAVAQIRLGDSAGRDNLILAANDSQRPPAALANLARILQHLQALGERTEEIASIKDLQRVARAEWRKAPPVAGDPNSYALFLCDGDVPASFASSSRTASKIQGQVEDVLAEGEDCLRQGRLEQAMAHAARAGAELDRVREELASAAPQQGISPVKFLTVRLSRLEKAAQVAKDSREAHSMLEVFRKRLRGIEESLQMKVPPGDLIQKAEILLDSSRTDAERAEAENILRECQDRVARHLLETANELLSSGEKEVAIGLLNRAQSLDSRVSDEIRLRLAGLRRDEIEGEISRAIASGSFEEARTKIAFLRTLHPIFEPVAARLDAEARSREADALVEQVVLLCGAKAPSRNSALEARRFLDAARALHPKPAALRPIEDQVAALEARLGIAEGGKEKPINDTKDPVPRSPRTRTGFALEPEGDPGAAAPPKENRKE